MPPDRPPSRAPRPALPAAVSTLSAALVHGAPRDATVVAAHRYALYLSVGGAVLPVVTSDAVQLPTAVRVAAAAGAVDWGVAAGGVGVVGDGRVVLPGLDLVAARSWRPARVRRVAAAAGCPGACSGGHLASRLEVSAAQAERAWLADGIRAALTRHRKGADAAVAGLVGRGAGLTPSGDDALAGALLVSHALGVGTDLADAVRARLGATTAVSAALLDAAADGYAAREVVNLVDSAVAADPGAVALALPAVLAVGHTSGADTVTGIRAALDTLTTCRECGNGFQDNHIRTHGAKAANDRSAA